MQGQDVLICDGSCSRFKVIVVGQGRCELGTRNVLCRCGCKPLDFKPLKRISTIPYLPYYLMMAYDEDAGQHSLLTSIGD